MSTLPFHRVLAPLDGSERAERGLEYAARLARPLGVGLTLLRVAASRRQMSQARTYLDGAAGRVAAEDLPVTTEVRIGDPIREVLAAVRDDDLVVLTSHGATGLERFLLGGTADRIVRYSPVPVFLARAFQPVATALSPLLVPLDGSEAAEAVLPYVRMLARALDADIMVLRAVHVRPFDAVAYPPQIVQMTLDWERTEGARYVQAIAESVVREGFRATGVIREAEPSDAIITAAAEEDGGFIAMTTLGRSGLARAVIGSVAARVSEGASDPVLLVKP